MKSALESLKHGRLNFLKEIAGKRESEYENSLSLKIFLKTAAPWILVISKVPY